MEVVRVWIVIFRYSRHLLVALFMNLSKILASDTVRNPSPSNLLRKVRRSFWRLTTKGFNCGWHITRYAMYNHLRSVCDGIVSPDSRVLSISRSQPLIDTVGLPSSAIVNADYPEHNMLSLDFADASFDCVVSDQVLEHLEGDPQVGIDECHRVLRPGGIAIHTTVFMYPIHGEPSGPDVYSDYWRFTPGALALLHRNWAQTLDVGGWGSLRALNFANDGNKYCGIPHAKWHPVHKMAVQNDPLWPMVTWIVAQK